MPRRHKNGKKNKKEKKINPPVFQSPEAGKRGSMALKKNRERSVKKWEREYKKPRRPTLRGKRIRIESRSELERYRDG